MAQRICLDCQLPFTPLNKLHKWCSRRCGGRVRQRARYNLVGPSALTRPCRHCGAAFTSPDGRQYYCSDRCCRTARSLRQVHRVYGISPERFQEMLLAQHGVCAICHLPERTERNHLLTVDHDHETGQVRALLCSQCNRAIGLLSDDPAVIRAAADYVQVHRVLSANPLS